MTKKEIEKKIAELLKQIWEVYKEYNPDCRQRIDWKGTENNNAINEPKEVI